MPNAANPDTRIPVVCVDAATVAGAEIFDPNSWSGRSKGIVQSCWTEYSVLHHCVGQILDVCKESDRLCRKHIDTIQLQWRASPFDLEGVAIYGQVPDLHMRIEAFLSGVKTLLDLIVQLLSSEEILVGTINGFHRHEDKYGGRVLNALKNNALKTKKEVASRLRALIVEHKALWIDEAIQARDQLIHPQISMHQLMFTLEFSEQANRLICTKISPPMIGSKAIDLYAEQTRDSAQGFSSKFLELLHE